jgi:hypothetical protein
MPKNQVSINKRREMIASRISTAKHPGREIQRIANELFLDESTIYRDLEASGIEKKNGFRY